MSKQIKLLIESKLPRMVGKTAVDHFKDNFYKGGFVDNGLSKWKEPLRYKANGKYADAKYGTLLSARNELFNSITYTAGNGTVTISSDKEYAEIHNEGGQINSVIPITDKMRKFAWAKHYETKQKDSKWKGLALTKKKSINHSVDMPQRRFIGESAELNQKIQTLIEKELEKIF
jgi:phage gpG-like protein